MRSKRWVRPYSFIKVNSGCRSKPVPEISEHAVDDGGVGDSKFRFVWKEEQGQGGVEQGRQGQ